MAFKENPNMLRAGNPVQAILDADWVGLSNFRTMFSEPEIFQAIKNTLDQSSADRDCVPHSHCSCHSDQ